MAGGSRRAGRGKKEQEYQQPDRRRRAWNAVEAGTEGGHRRGYPKSFGEAMVTARPGMDGGAEGEVILTSGEEGARCSEDGEEGVASPGSGGGGAPLPPRALNRVSARKLAASKWAETVLAPPPFAAAPRPPRLPSCTPDTLAPHPSDASPSISICTNPSSRFPSLPLRTTPRFMPRKCARVRTDSTVGTASKTIGAMLGHPSRHVDCYGNLILRQVSTLESQHGMSAANQVAALAKKLRVGEAAQITFPEDHSKPYDRLQSCRKQNRGHKSITSALREELEFARVRLQKLDAAQTSALNEVDILLESYVNESIARKSKEQKTFEAAMLLFGNQLEEERNIRKKLERQYKKLSKNLTKVNRAASKAMKELKRERNTRKLMEEVCDELAKEIWRGKAAFEELQQEHAIAKYEIEEERMMFETAQLWREERAQIKFSEARLELEERSMALNKLTAELEAFLHSKGNCQIEGTLQQQAETNQAERLRQAVGNLHKQTAISVRSLEDTICQPA